MRTMKKDKTRSVLNVQQHIILRNFWEYYLEKADSHNVAFGFVMGLENELGYVNLDEIAPYIMSQTLKLDDIVPAVGWHWVGNQE